MLAGVSTTAESVDLRRVRLALMSLGGPPQAQRHHVRAGLLQRACGTIEEIAPQLPQLEAAGSLKPAQAAALAAVARQLGGLSRSWSARIPPEPSRLGFDFLLGNAFEDPEWDRLRLTARSAFTVMRAADNPWIG